jgi:hypothetical protein
MQKRLIGAAAIAVASVALAIPSGAGAVIKAGDRTFVKTFPVASHFCTEVAAGNKPHYKTVMAAVLADCTTLQANFTSAQSAVLTTRASLTSQIAADKALVTAACPKPMLGKPACHDTRKTQHAAIEVLRAERRAAVHLYYITVESDRRAFWHAIHLLKGLAHVPADKPIKIQKV